MKRFLKERLIVVSNREPYSVKGRSEKTVGGLVSALDPVMQRCRGIWIADGAGHQRAAKGEEALRFMVPFDRPSYTMRLVPLTRTDIEGYYNGYSNRLLWPLCHITLDRIYHKKFYWRTYEKVNKLFADAVLEEAGRKRVTVWLQDYHLALCAREIKRRRPGIKTSIFWHIPWPPHGVFRICPQRKEILEGMLGNDLIGFHLDSFKANFMRAVDVELGAGVDYREGYINFRGHTTKVRAFPISIDFEWFNNAASAESAERFMKRFLRTRGLEGLKIGLSVDRLDYTKGIIKCLEALELFFAKYPRFRERFTYIQVAVPTRKIEPFLSYTERVRKKVENVNRKFSRGRWRPVEYIEGKFSQNELAALYRFADVMMITSVYDGMNLVAKEYVASQVDKKGVLLLSEFTGAAEELPGVTLINPYATEACADAVKEALEARPEVKRKNLEIARAHVKKNNIYRWVDNILKELEKIR